MNSGATSGQGMSPYEEKAWADLQEYWRKKAEGRNLPPALKDAAGAAASKIGHTASSVRNVFGSKTPQAVKDVGGVVADIALEPTIRAVGGLLEWVTETVEEFSDPEPVFSFHREQGRPVATLADLQSLDLLDLDASTKGFVWKWRSTGVVEGGAMGALTFVPVAGSIASIGLDLVVIHALTTAIATRAAHSYGLDPSSDAGREHLNRMLRKAWAAQAPKAGTVRSAKNAFVAGQGRVNWSAKFRDDHRVAAAVEKLMRQLGNGKHVPIDKVVTKLPYIALVTAAGVNSSVLGSMARDSVRYSQTIYLAQKHGLALPSNLV